jgi:hypothetical protein
VLCHAVLCHAVCVYRVLFSTDQGFPLAAAFAYSVYQFQSKRVKRNPEGPFFGGNAIVGAIFSTLCCLAVACGVSALVWFVHACEPQLAVSVTQHPLLMACSAP